MPKLLLADDSPTTQKVVQLTFADEGIDVVIADDGDTAMEMFDHHHPDIVLADINIPGLNGYEVCEAIRKRESNGKTPVVLLAGSFEPFDVEAAHRVGANDYLTKPFSSIRRLIATVTTLLDIAVKADDNAHDTVEPEGGESGPYEATPQAENHLAPGSKQSELEEPDMLSTSDIENLYTQSVSDPVDISSQTDQSDPAEPHTPLSDETEQTAPDDLAFDDELIETTYIDSETEQTQQAAATDEPEVEAPEPEEPPIENLSAPQIPVPMDELPPEEVPQSQIPTVRFRTPTDENAVDTEVRPSEDFRSRSFSGNTIETIRPISFGRIDQTNDEAYFEPAPEPAAPVEQTEQHAYQPAESASEESTSELQSSQPEVEQQSYELSDGNEQSSSIGFETNETTSQSVETVEETKPEQSENVESALPAPSTPWDSIADPQPQAFTLDESNLLELPIDRNGETAQHAERTDTAASSAAFELAPEIVDQIAKLTAAHISEEMIRAIAKRIVPKVIEEVMTGHHDDGTKADPSDATS